MNTLLAVLSAVVNSLWQALAVAVLVWLVMRFAPRINAATRYAIWWATLGVVLILPVAPRLILMMRPHPKPSVIAVVKTPKVTAPPVPIEPVIVTVPPGRTAIWPIAVLAVWTAILLWRLFQIVRSYFYLRGVKRRAAVSPIPLPAIPRHADLLISPDTVSPMAVGFLRPAVVLPESLLAELSEPEREHVLLHESAHLAKYL
jgi:beta-lactamase regulating signal transducer with metallopeptidase domain